MINRCVTRRRVAFSSNYDIAGTGSDADVTDGVCERCGANVSGCKLWGKQHCLLYVELTFHLLKMFVFSNPANHNLMPSVILSISILHAMIC